MSSSHLFFLLATVATFSIAHGQQNCTNRFGNANRGQCQVVDECQGAALAPTVGQCSQANQICCINDPRPTPTIPGGVKLTRAMFLRLVGNTTRNNYMYNYVVSSMNLAGLFAGSNSDYKVAAYLAQLVGETDYFRNLESKIWDDPDNNPYLGNKLPGDGVKFMGRGAILVRGRDNYENANSSKSLNLGFDLIAEPEQAAYPSIAFRLATWFWRENAYVILGNERAFKGDLSRLVDGTFLNFTHLTHALTNNLQALKDRAELNDLALAELKVTSMKRGQGVECSIGDELGYAVPICLIDFQKQYCGCEGEVNNRGCPYGETEDGRCRSSAIIKCCVERCSSSLDLTIAMDSSGSIGSANFAVQTKFVKSLLGGLNLAPNFTQIGLIDFNTQPTLLIDFVTFVDLNSTLKVIDSIKYLPNRLTYTDRALRMANEEVMQERRGMRPMESATPKVVMVITDGLSTDPKRTLDEADRIKERGIDIISVGIGEDSNIDELVGIASTPDDQYFVEDFDKLYLIISGLQKTTCQKPAEIPPQVAVKGTVEKKSYKYYRVNIADADFGLESNRFTVQMDTLVGQADLFYSFTNENPKSDEDFVDPNKDKPSWEGNFVEKTSSSASVARRQRSIRSAQEDERASGKTVMRAVSQSFYQIERPQEAPNDVLYFSVRGLESSNEFEVYVHNRTVNAANKSIYLSSGSIGFVLIINFIISLGVF